MTTPVFNLNIPSNLKTLLVSLIGRKLIEIIRFNSDSIDYLINICNLLPSEFFSLCEGSVLFYFDDGLVVGGSSDPSRNSVLLWVEKNEIGEVSGAMLEEWDEAIPFSSNNFSPWKNFSGEIIKSVFIFKECDDENHGISNLPNERGVLLQFENESSLIISHGLNNNSDDTSIITLKNIDPYFNKKLKYIELK